MAETAILDTAQVAELEVRLEEATRSSSSGVHRFIEPAAGTLTRATSRTHHLIFGRRGSGKSSLLRKAAQDLTVDRRPIAFVDLETFKGHEYPDVLISVLIETFNKFAEWLETAAIAPANKTSFWTRLFGQKPTRPPFNKSHTQTHTKKKQQQHNTKKEQHKTEDDTEVESTVLNKEAATESDSAKVGAVAAGVAGA